MHEETTTIERRLTVVPDEIQASMVCSLLASNGIACLQRRTASAGVDWGIVNVGMSGHREVLVPDHQLDEARALLAGLGDGDVSSSPALGTRDLPQLTDAEEARQLTGMRRLQRGYALLVLALFGVPVLAGLIFQLVFAARSMS
jgi:hypothetical protein